MLLKGQDNETEFDVARDRHRGAAALTFRDGRSIASRPRTRERLGLPGQRDRQPLPTTLARRSNQTTRAHDHDRRPRTGRRRRDPASHTTIPAELELDVPTTVAPAPAPELELDVPTTVASLRGPQVGRSRVPAIDAVKDTYEIDFVITYDVAGDWTWAYTQGGNFCKVKEMKVGETFMIVNGNVVGLFDPNRFRVQIVDLKGRSCKATVSIDSGVPINEPGSSSIRPIPTRSSSSSRSIAGWRGHSRSASS